MRAILRPLANTKLQEEAKQVTQARACTTTGAHSDMKIHVHSTHTEKPTNGSEDLEIGTEYVLSNAQ